MSWVASDSNCCRHWQVLSCWSRTNALLDTNKSFLEWLPSALESCKGPCIALAFSSPSIGDAPGLRIRPLLCVCPHDASVRSFDKYEYMYNHQSSRFEINAGIKHHPPQTPLDHVVSAPSTTNAWDASRIPVEIYKQIMKDISREDVRSLRLVSRAFERGVSGALFETVVVPFGTEVYGSITTRNKSPQSDGHTSTTGKHATSSAAPQSPEDLWTTPFVHVLNGIAQDDELMIFKQFGSHIRQFGMSLEVNPKNLIQPAEKAAGEGYTTYWGAYDWPFPDYNRFRERERLETIADETSTMKTAFSYLVSVKHLALSVDSGQGWVRGSDLSLRSIILERPSSVFQSLHFERTDATTLSQRTLWELLETSYAQLDAKPKLYFANMRQMEVSHEDIYQLQSHKTNKWITTKQTLLWVPFEENTSQEASSALPSEENAESTALGSSSSREHTRLRIPSTLPSLIDVMDIQDDDRLEVFDEDIDGRLPITSMRPNAKEIAFAHPNDSGKDAGISKATSGILAIMPTSAIQPSIDDRLLPSKLTARQMEWLMETTWAQDAFLSSYILAVESFNHVKTLTLSRFSSKFLPKFLRQDFWGSLSTLTTFNIRVIADWFDVRTDETGTARSFPMRPSEAIKPYQSLVEDFIAPLSNITTLSIGWADGGEHAEGLLARNTHLLPVPFMARNLLLLPSSTAEVSFPYVKHLTIDNCWITPNVLIEFVQRHMKHEMVCLTLESVSLTSQPVVQAAANLLPAAAQLNHIIGAIARLPAHVTANMARWAAPPSTQHDPMQAHTTDVNQVIHAVAAFAAATSVAVQAQQNPSGLREGSWPHVLECIKEYGCTEECTGLEITFRSCGHAILKKPSKLDDTVLKQAVMALFETDQINNPNPAFANRRSALVTNGGTLDDAEPLHGEVLSVIPQHEMHALSMYWGLHAGWPTKEFLDKEYDDENGWGKYGERSKEGAVYDGHRPGGSGKFSGRVMVQ